MMLSQNWVQVRPLHARVLFARHRHCDSVPCKPDKVQLRSHVQLLSHLLQSISEEDAGNSSLQMLS